jgi:hypothetical protein
LDKYKPEYNVLNVAGNSFGFKHSIETIIELKQRLNKENHPKFGTVTSSETKKSISLSNFFLLFIIKKNNRPSACARPKGAGVKNFYLTKSHPAKGLKGKFSAQYGIGGNSVFCYSKTDKELIFPSINAAKQHFKVR